MMLARAGRLVALVLLGLAMLVPLYLLVVNAFKSEQDIRTTPFGIPWDRLSFEYLWGAIVSPQYNVIAAYGVTAFFVVAICFLSLVVTIPAAYVISRGVRRRHRIVLVFLLAGLFIPSHVLVIPVIYVLKSLGLMGTIPGYLIFETALSVPVAVFLLSGFMLTIPRELDEAAMLDGASRWRILWSVIIPLTRPAIATVVVLRAMSVWTDYVNPAIILGPSSGIYTVTTGVYAAMGQYATEYTRVYPNLLLAALPILVFFVFMQKQIMGGLTAGALKG